MSEEIKMLDMDTARTHGITCAEEILDTVCYDCSKSNPDGNPSEEFCDIQARYGAAGEHPSIVYRENPFGFRCNEYRRLTDAECGKALKKVFDAAEKDGAN